MGKLSDDDLAKMRKRVHAATPADPDAGMTSCLVCKEVVRPVPGGQGRTWVHDATGAVAASGGASD